MSSRNRSVCHTHMEILCSFSLGSQRCSAGLLVHPGTAMGTEGKGFSRVLFSGEQPGAVLVLSRCCPGAVPVQRAQKCFSRVLFLQTKQLPALPVPRQLPALLGAPALLGPAPGPALVTPQPWCPLVPSPCRGGDTVLGSLSQSPGKLLQTNQMEHPTVKVLQKHEHWTLHLGRIKLLKNFFH